MHNRSSPAVHLLLAELESRLLSCEEIGESRLRVGSDGKTVLLRVLPSWGGKLVVRTGVGTILADPLEPHDLSVVVDMPDGQEGLRQSVFYFVPTHKARQHVNHGERQQQASGGKPANVIYLDERTESQARGFAAKWAEHKEDWKAVSLAIREAA